MFVFWVHYGGLAVSVVSFMAALLIIIGTLSRHEEASSPAASRDYALPAEVLGCNLRCWNN